MHSEVIAVEPQRILDIFEKQKKRSLLLRSESVSDRKKRIRAFGDSLLHNKERISEAVFKDFRKPSVESDISELYPVLTEIRHTIANLDECIIPIGRFTDNDGSTIYYRYS